MPTIVFQVAGPATTTCGVVHGIAGRLRGSVGDRRASSSAGQSSGLIIRRSRVRAPPGTLIDTLNARASDADQAGGQLGAPCLRRLQLTLDRPVGLAMHPERLGGGPRAAPPAPHTSTPPR